MSVFTCDLCGDELTCINPSQTADHRFGGKNGKLDCSVFKKEAIGRAVEERASQEQPRKHALHGCSSALAARRLLSIHTNSRANDWSFWGYIYSKGHSRLALERADRWVYIKQNSPNTAVLPSDCTKTEWEICLQLLEDE
jgi:hypothetical protein